MSEFVTNYARVITFPDVSQSNRHTPAEVTSLYLVRAQRAIERLRAEAEERKQALDIANALRPQLPEVAYVDPAAQAWADTYQTELLAKLTAEQGQIS